MSMVETTYDRLQGLQFEGHLAFFGILYAAQSVFATHVARERGIGPRARRP